MVGKVAVLKFKVNLVLLNQHGPLILFSQEDAFTHDVVVANMQLGRVVCVGMVRVA